MPVATPVLQKQQNKPPTSMRYQRVEDIIQNDLRLKRFLGPKNQVVDSRFGPPLTFAKEVVEVTQAIHSEGKDAHKVPKHEVLRVAMRIMKIGSPSNGQSKITAPLIPPLNTPEPASPPKKQEAPKKSTQKKVQPSKPTPKPNSKTQKKPQPKSSSPVPVVKKESTAKKPVKTRPVPIKTKAPETNEAAVEPELPESELPPEKQPLRLPAKYDPTKHPHYDVQSSIYSLLLTALTLAVHFEKKPGYEERQKVLDEAVQTYLDSCNQLKLP